MHRDYASDHSQTALISSVGIYADGDCGTRVRKRKREDLEDELDNMATTFGRAQRLQSLVCLELDDLAAYCVRFKPTRARAIAQHASYRSN